MADPEPVYLKVDVNFNGGFIRHPCSYAGGERHLFTDVDFAGMNFEGFVFFLQHFFGQDFEKVYYRHRGRPLSTGIRWLENDLDYAFFLDTAYEEPDELISVYLDHSGDGLEDWFDTSTEEEGSVIQGSDNEGSEKGEKDKEPSPTPPPMKKTVWLMKCFQMRQSL